MFVGVDLAWSDSNKSGLCELSSRGEILTLTTVKTDSDITGFDGQVIAVDAPLIVPNKNGRRPAEAELQETFQQYNAGAYPANRKWLTKIGNGRIRGEDILHGYEQKGYSRQPFNKKKRCVEVYPHPAQIALFGLDTVLPYKPGKGRTKKTRFKALQQLERCIRSLDDITYDRRLLPPTARETTLKEMKDVEDMLDAVVCAYVAYLLYTEPKKMKMYGTVEGGYIIAPKL